MTVREHMILRLAAARYLYPAERENDALEHVGLRPTPFWAAVNRLLDRADVMAEYPLEVGRLRRMQERRAAARSSRRMADDMADFRPHSA